MTRFPDSNWSSARSHLRNGHAGDGEQPTDNRLWGHVVAKEQDARNQGEVPFGASVSGDKNPVPDSTRKKVREGFGVLSHSEMP
jgi:hypothetical protein